MRASDHPRLASITSALTTHWLLSVVGILAAFQLAVFGMVALQEGRLPLRQDSAVFQYAGWYMAQGGDLYTQIWEIKLPLAYEIPALLALFSGGNILVHHLLNVALTMALGIGSGVLVALLVDEITDDQEAALLSGVSVLLLPGFFYLPSYGFKVKFFSTFATLLAIYLARTDRPTLSGAAAAACVGVYHLAVVVPFLSVALSYQYQQTRGAARAIAGGIGFTAVMVAPVVIAGNTEAMIAEVIVIPYVIDSGMVNPISAFLHGGIHFGATAPAVLLGAIGIILSVTEYNWKETWWLIAAAGWFGFAILFIDYDNYPDLISGLVFVAVGVGIVYATLSERRTRASVAGLVSVSITVNLILVLAIGGIGGIYAIESAQPLDELENTTHQAPSEGSSTFEVERPDIRYQYWNQIESDTCHVRLSSTELAWLQLTEKPLMDQHCGDLDRAMSYTD